MDITQIKAALRALQDEIGNVKVETILADDFLSQSAANIDLALNCLGRAEDEDALHWREMAEEDGA